MSEKSQNSLKYYLSPKSSSKKTLVLDLDETLVHSQFVPFSIKSDLILKIELEDQLHDIHVLIRPGVQKFLQKMGQLYEIVIFTASVSKYADPLLDIIDKNHTCSCRLFREHCSMVGITYIKDLKKLGRDLKDIIIVDNSPLSYSLNYENGLPILTWLDDKNDKELYNITPILEFLSNVYDVRDYIKQFVVNDNISYDKAIIVIENYEKLKHDDKNKTYIDEIIYNKKNYIKKEKKNEGYSSYDEKDHIFINNNTIGKKDKKNFVNITISNNAINNYLYFSPIYNISNNPLNINNSKNNDNLLINVNNMDNNNKNIDMKLNPKSFPSKKLMRTKTNRTKSKGLLNKITINKRDKIKTRSNNFKKINLKEKINSAGNKSINYFININNNSDSKEHNNILDLKTIVTGKKSNLIRDYQLPKTPEIEQILYPLQGRIINKINSKKTFINLNKNKSQERKVSSTEKNRNDKYQFRNSLYKFNSQLRPNSIINHEKHKSFNYYSPLNCEHNMVNTFKKSYFSNETFFEPITDHSYKNNSHSNHKIIKTIKNNKLYNNNKNLSLKLANKTYAEGYDNNNIGKNNKTINKSKISLINNCNKKAINNQFKIIGITEFNKSNKIKQLINYNLVTQNSNSINNNNNYKKINITNRAINTDNFSLKNYNRGISSSNYRTINNNLSRTSQIVPKKIFNNSIFKNNMKKNKTNSTNFFNYDNFISHKKTLSFNGTEINSFKNIKRTNSTSISKNKNLKDKKSISKEVYNNNTINQKNNNIIKLSKRDISDAIRKKMNNKITKIKDIKYINNYVNNTNKASNKMTINNKAIYNLIEKNGNININKLKKISKIKIK